LPTPSARAGNWPSASSPGFAPIRRSYGWTRAPHSSPRSNCFAIFSTGKRTPMADADRTVSTATSASRGSGARRKTPPAKGEVVNLPVDESLPAIERVRLARDPRRPQTQDYIDGLITDFIELHGDRRFADDQAIVAGMGYLARRPVIVVGHQRGRSTAERLKRNFGKPHPEGYRKAARLYDLAHRFRLPLITFIDTQGAEPGVGAEERGQAEAIAANLELMARLETPILSCVIGEGGSGGALALGVANVILML